VRYGICYSMWRYSDGGGEPCAAEASDQGRSAVARYSTESSGDFSKYREYSTSSTLDDIPSFSKIWKR